MIGGRKSTVNIILLDQAASNIGFQFGKGKPLYLDGQPARNMCFVHERVGVYWDGSGGGGLDVMKKVTGFRYCVEPGPEDVKSYALDTGRWR